MKLKYVDSPNNVLLEGDEEIRGGQEFEVSDKRAKELKADPNVNVEAVSTSKSSESNTDSDKK